MNECVDIGNITGVVLAGGRGSRLGGVDKGLMLYEGTPLIERLMDVLRPQVGKLIINANRHHIEYARYGWPVVADEWNDFRGPLAGIASAMRVVETEYLLTVPCDSPHLPPDLALRLWQAMERDGSEAATVSVEGRLQPVYALLRRGLLASAQGFLSSGQAGVGVWLRRQRLSVADFSAQSSLFININTLEDCHRWIKA